MSAVSFLTTGLIFNRPRLLPEGFWNGSRVPLGYVLIEVEKRGIRIKKTLFLDTSESETVKLIFQLYLNGDGASGALGVKDVVKWLAHGRIMAQGAEGDAVRLLPVFALGADDAITRGLRRAGLKTIGDVAARDRNEIAARFSTRFVDLLQQALREADAPINKSKTVEKISALN